MTTSSPPQKNILYMKESYIQGLAQLELKSVSLFLKGFFQLMAYLPFSSIKTIEKNFHNQLFQPVELKEENSTRKRYTKVTKNEMQH